MNEGLKARMESEAKAVKRKTNDDLVCKDCLFRYDDGVIFGNTSKCEVFMEKKPNNVIMGGECWEYVKE